ncbi:hypothetical protein BGX27_009918 [Mortierella sp. AM989]|nr:hypothetical protein BGX27_009918 [Mortierella sp. AM989]
MGYTFTVELYTEEPFVLTVDQGDKHVRTLSGRVVLELSKPENFKIATVAVHGHIGVALNIDTKPTIVHERLLNLTTDLIAANDREGHGVLRFSEPGTHYIPFRIDIPRLNKLPPTLLNKLDTPYVDWKYEIHATLQRDSIFSSPSVVKHDLILRRSIKPENESPVLSASTDMPSQFRSRLSAPSSITLGQNTLPVSVELKARHKSYMIREIDCAVVQTEDICYYTKHGHPNVNNAQDPGVRTSVGASRLVSSIKKISNDEADLNFGRGKPLQLDIHLDNFQLIPTERGLDWFEISHVLKFTVYFMDMNLEPIITELPIFVGHDSAPSHDFTVMNAAAAGAARLMQSLIVGAENHLLHSDNEVPPEAI